MLSVNQITISFNHQNLCEESSGILVIFHGVGLQAKAASEKAGFWSDVVRFVFHTITLHDSFINNILGENQVIS